MKYETLTEGLSDTIAAQSTARGQGAIAIVRLSGPQAYSIAARLARYTDTAVPISHRMQRVALFDGQEKQLDDAMMVWMQKPRSYTGEDMVELHLHGAQAVVLAVLDACYAQGARAARAGEFTLRAFLNGRMDLTQAEAVGQLLAAQTQTQRQSALRVLDGAFSARVLPWLEEMEGILAAWRAVLDFPEYPTGDAPTAAQLQSLRDILKRIRTTCQSVKTDLGRPFQVALCGAPNTGKSTLLNAWAEDERAMVDATPGTTRDAIGVPMHDHGINWYLWDTAGMRPEAQGVEARGIEITRSRAEAADRVLWLLSADQPVWPPDAWEHVWVVGSRADRLSDASRRAFEADVAMRPWPFLGWISVHTQTGLDSLRARVAGAFRETKSSDEALLVVKSRQLEQLKAAAEALTTCLEAADAQATLDVLMADLEWSVRALGALLGRDVDAAVLDRVFGDFCIGK